jgi:hypothetical protein
MRKLITAIALTIALVATVAFATDNPPIPAGTYTCTPVTTIIDFDGPGPMEPIAGPVGPPFTGILTETPLIMGPTLYQWLDNSILNPLTLTWQGLDTWYNQEQTWWATQGGPHDGDYFWGRDGGEGLTVTLFLMDLDFDGTVDSYVMFTTLDSGPVVMESGTITQN